MPLNTVNQKVKPVLLTALTATGTTQATALPLVHNSNSRFDTVASGTGAVLPTPVIPDEITVYNNGASALSIYPPIGGAINGGTVNTAVSLAAGSAITYWGAENLDWWTKTTGGGAGGGGGGSGGVTSVSFTGDGVVFTASAGTAVTSTGTLAPSLISQAKNVVLAGPSTGSNSDPTFRALVAADLPPGTGSGTVTSVSFTGDGTVFTASADTPVTASGTLTPSLVSQAKNVVLAGPLSGSNAAPTFRALVAADLPSGTGSGTVTSVSFTGDGTVFTASADTPVTASGTLTPSLVSQAANVVLAGPLSGSNAPPTFRTLVAADIPDITTNRPFTWALGVTTNGVAMPVAVATNPASVYLICSKAGTFTRVDMIAGTGPTGSALVVNILKSSNQGSTWTSLWASSANYPSIAAGAVSGSTTSFTTTTYSAGDILRLDVTQVGSSIAGNNVTVTLDTAMTT